ncbi:MAG: tetratricopeptide repeat protein [Anaerolineae bacterium]
MHKEKPREAARTVDIGSEVVHPPTNLPLQLTSFVGRERELALVRGHLAHAHLVTLIGVGGSGKTRLAHQVAFDCLNDFPSGVWWTEMGALDDSSLVPQAVAASLSLRGEFTPGGLVEIIVDTLREARALLVFDNCEHVAAATAQVAEAILRACPGVTILTASRELLNVPGEKAFTVPSLSVPEPPPLQNGAAGPHREHIASYEAVRLFVERASVADPDFALTDANAPVVARICQRLDGIPLAIELAAARVKVLSVEQVAARLDDRFHLLVGGSRTALPRYRTMRATLDWSHELLSPEERVLFRRLSVFARDFTLEAAEAVAAGVCPDDTIARGDVLDLLSHLVDKSLLERHQRVEGATARYRMLETVYEYAREKLVAAAETEAVQRRHLRWFLVLAQQAASAVRGPRQGEWLDRLEVEHENLRAALAWSQDDADSHLDSLRLGAALFWFWYLRGYTTEGRTWLTAILKRGPVCEHQEPDGYFLADIPLVPAEAVEPRRVYAAVLLGAGVLAAFQDDYAVARVYFDECIAIYENTENQRGLAYALMFAGLEADFEADYPRAREMQPISVEMFRELGDRWGLAWALNFLAMSSLVAGNYATIRGQLEESLSLFHEIGDEASAAMPLGLLGMIDQRQGNYASALRRLEQAMDIYRHNGDRWHMAFVLTNLGLTEFRLKKYDRARQCLEDAVNLYRNLGDKGALATALSDLGDVAMTQGDDAEAERWYKESLALWEKLNIPGGIAWVRHNLAFMDVLRGRLDEAQAVFEASAAVLRQMNDDYYLASVLVSQAITAVYQGNYPLAHQLCCESLGIRLTLGDRRGMGDTMTIVGMYAHEQGQMATCVQMFGVAKATRDSLEAPLAERYLPLHNQYLSNARAVLGESQFQELWNAGLALPLDQAVATLLQSSHDNIQLPRPAAIPAVEVLEEVAPVPVVSVRVDTVRIYGLGNAQLYRGDYHVQPPDYTYTRAPELLFYLLTQPNRSMHAIGAAIWPEATPQQMRGRFHTTLHNLRKVLGDRDWILRSRDEYTFNRDLPHWCDVEAFDTEAAVGQRLTATEPARAIDHLQRAVDLYRGLFLNDVGSPWAVPTRQALDMTYMRALLALGRLHYEAGHFAEADTLFRRAAEHDDYEEAAHRGIMQCHVRLGERGQAVRHYQTLAVARKREHMSPDQETTALYEKLRTGQEI